MDEDLGAYHTTRDALRMIEVPHRMLPRLRNRLNPKQEVVPVGHPSLEWVAFIIFYIY